MSVLRFPARRAGRAVALCAASLAVLVVGAPAAGAADIPAVSVDVPALDITLRTTYGAVPEVGAFYTGAYPDGSSTVAYGGTLIVSLPASVEAGPSFSVEVGLKPLAGTAPTRTYSSTSAVPADHLAVTGLGGGRFEVALPADDGVNGDHGHLVLYGLVATGGADVPITHMNGMGIVNGSFVENLQFGAAPANVDLPVGAVIENYLCGNDRTYCAETVPLAAGAAFDLVLPDGAVLGTLGLTDLRWSAAQIFAGRDANGQARNITLTGTPSADGRSVRMVLSGDVPTGERSLTVQATDPTGTVFARVLLHVDVTAANAGLRSNTGWIEPAGDEGASPLVPVGAGMVLVAGIGAVAVLRRRTWLQQ